MYIFLQRAPCGETCVCIFYINPRVFLCVCLQAGLLLSSPPGFEGARQCFVILDTASHPRRFFSPAPRRATFPVLLFAFRPDILLCPRRPWRAAERQGLDSSAVLPIDRFAWESLRLLIATPSFPVTLLYALYTSDP